MSQDDENKRREQERIRKEIERQSRREEELRRIKREEEQKRNINNDIRKGRPRDSRPDKDD